MLEYVYAFCDGEDKKIPCSAREGNLPDFSGIGETKQSYEKKLLQYEEYLEWYRELDAKRRTYNDLFYKNIGLFIENHAKILPNPRFAAIKWPRTIFFGACAGMVNASEITLGELLSIYANNEPMYISTCQKCGRKKHLVFGEKTEFLCTACGVVKALKNSTSYFELGRIRDKYKIEYKNAKPFHITQLIKFLQQNIMPTVNDTEANLPIYHSNYCKCDYFKIITKKPIDCYLEKSDIHLGNYFDFDNINRHFVSSIYKKPIELFESIPERCWTSKFKIAVKKAGHKGFMGEW